MPTGNRTVDVVLTQQVGGIEYPVFGLARLGPSIYPLAVRFPDYASFSVAAIPQLFGATAMQQRAEEYDASAGRHFQRHELSLQLAGRMVGESLDRDRQLRLVDEYIAELTAMPAANGNGHRSESGSDS